MAPRPGGAGLLFYRANDFIHVATMRPSSQSFSCSARNATASHIACEMAQLLKENSHVSGTDKMAESSNTDTITDTYLAFIN